MSEQAVSVSALAPPVTVRIGNASYTLDPLDGDVVVGTAPDVAIRIDDERISSSHLRLEPHPDGWQAIDTSTNGIFVDAVRRSSVLISGPTTIHLGSPDGIPMILIPGDPLAAASETTGAARELHVAEEPLDETDIADPDVARAGRAVAARRRELNITQRSLARDKIINAGALIAFEKGRSWPRRGTLAKLEEVLHWPPGTIARIRSGAAPLHESQDTEVVTNMIQAPLMAEAVELAVHAIAAAIAALPEPSDPDYATKAAAILADLRKLEAVATDAAHSARGTPMMVLALSHVRRSYNEVMLRAARSPTATLGQRLYGARYEAELSAEETADAAGLPVEVITAAEAERPIPSDAADAIKTVIAQLSH